MNLETVILEGIDSQASEVFLSPDAPPYFRINGSLKSIKQFPTLCVKDIADLIKPLLDENQSRSLTKNGNIQFIYFFSKLNVKCKINIFSQINGFAVSFRYIRPDIPALEEIGAPDVIKDLLRIEHGLILVSGPEGSGKTSTVASMIQYINSYLGKHIITLENNIEYVFKSNISLINQLQLDFGKELQQYLRISLNSNPDIIVIGEIQNRETMRMILNTAETGHLVISTLNSSSVVNAIQRMIDFFPGSEKEIIRNLLGNIFQGIICQKLILNSKDGRTALFEILLSTTATRNLIRENKIELLENIMELNQEIGMSTFDTAVKNIQRVERTGIMT